MSITMILSRSAARLHLSQRLQMRVSETCQRLWQDIFHPYRPELYYMRGPGPKWHEKHRR